MPTLVQPSTAVSGQEQVLDPVPLFSRIQIQTVSWCNRSCAFCPSGKFPLEKALMPLAVYHRVIDQLQALHYTGRISPYLMNESLLDKRLPDLLAYTRAQCPAAWIAINTNGDAVSEHLLEHLYDAGMNSLDVNAYDSPAQHAAHVALATRLVTRRPDITLRTGYSNPFFQGTDLPRRMRLLNCRDMSFWEARFVAKIATPDLQNRSGNIPGARHVAAPLALGCQRPSQQMYVNYRGEAVLCCNDWRSTVIMGDTAHATLGDIWMNDKYQQYRRKLQHKNRAMPLCDTCDYMADASDWE